MKTINEKWLKEIAKNQTMSVLLRLGLLFILNIFMLKIFGTMGLNVTDLLITLGIIITAWIIFKIYSYSQHYHALILRRTFWSEHKRLQNLSNEINILKKKYEKFIEEITDGLVARRLNNSKEIKEFCISRMKKIEKEINQEKIRIKKLLNNEDADHIKLIRLISDLEEDADLNVENLLDSLSLISKEDATWENGGKESYRKRIVAWYRNHHEPLLKIEISWFNELLRSCQEEIDKIESFAKEKGIAL